ncbi:MAG: nuclear transport factor 2 family protein [Vitreimonas sp.]
MRNLRINQLSASAFDWYRRYMTLYDLGDIERLRAYVSADCTFQINNNVPIHGADAMALVMHRLHTRYRRIEREVVNIYGSDLNFASEMLWHYTRLDDSRVTVPAAHFIDRGGDGLIVSIHVYADTAPVYT